MEVLTILDTGTLALRSGCEVVGNVRGDRVTLTVEDNVDDDVVLPLVVRAYCEGLGDVYLGVVVLAVRSGSGVVAMGLLRYAEFFDV